jgi:hypothetical protein
MNLHRALDSIPLRSIRSSNNGNSSLMSRFAGELAISRKELHRVLAGATIPNSRQEF